MMEPIPDPDVPDSPHLSGGQPSWSDLPYLCEMLQWFHQQETKDPVDVHESILDATQSRDKVGQLFTFATKAGILDDGYQLMPAGLIIAEAFTEAKQASFDYSASRPPLGPKENLSTQEQLVYKTLLFDRDWLPMVAAVNQIATTSVPDADTDEDRAAAFEDRVDHLEGYQDVDSVSSWDHKAKLHFEWLEHLEIVESDGRKFTLTSIGSTIHDRLSSYYPSDW
jgi:hypothetical protein